MAIRPATYEPRRRITTIPRFNPDEIRRLHGERGVKIVSLRYGNPSLSLEEIGHRVGLTKQGVSVALRRIKEGRSGKKGRPAIAAEKIEQIFDLTCLGYYASYVAEQVGISPTTVSNYIRKASSKHNTCLRIVALSGTCRGRADITAVVPRDKQQHVLKLLGLKEWPRRFLSRYDIEPDIARRIMELANDAMPKGANVEWSLSIQRVT